MASVSGKDPAHQRAARAQLTAVTERARADLAARLSVHLDDIGIVTADAVTWPDGSLGCPEPGRMYTQALVDGYRAVLGHSGRVYMYHSAQDGQPFLCPSGQPDGGREFVPPPGIDV